VRFVEDHDFIAASGGSIADHFPQLANLIDAAIGRRVNFDYIERISQTDFAARVALIARLRCGTLRAIESLGKNTRRGRFPDAARPRKDVSVSHAAGLYGVGKRPRYVLLADYIGKCLRPPFPRYDLIAHLQDSRLLNSNPKNLTQSPQRITENYGEFFAPIDALPWLISSEVRVFGEFSITLATEDANFGKLLAFRKGFVHSIAIENGALRMRGTSGTPRRTK